MYGAITTRHSLKTFNHSLIYTNKYFNKSPKMSTTVESNMINDIIDMISIKLEFNKPNRQ